MKKILSIFAIAVLVLAGCSKGGSKAPEEVAQGVTDTTVKVANCATTSGAYAPVGTPFLAGMRAYFKMINEAGGVNGRKIEYVHQDDEFNPEKGKAALDRMVNDEKVFALVGHFGTPIVGATLNDIKEIGIPAVYFATGTGILYNENATEEGRNIYPVQPVYPMEGRIMAAWAKGELKGTKIGVVYTNDDAGKDLLSGVENQVKKLGGDYIVVKEQVNPGATDVSSAVLKMKNENVDVIIAASIQATLPTIVKGLISQGVSKPVFTTYSNADATTIANFAADYASTSNKFPIYSNAWVDLSDAEEVNAFVEGMANFGQPDYAANAFAMAGWIAGHFMSEGLKRVEGQTLNWENFMKAMESAEFKIPMGGTINYSDGNRLGTQSMSLLKVSEDGTTWVNHKPVEDLNVILDRVK